MGTGTKVGRDAGRQGPAAVLRVSGSEGDRRVVYMDHPASTAVDPRVLAAMAPWWTAGNPHSVHAAGRRARDAVEAARAQVAGLVGADPRGVAFTSGATEAANLALRGLLSGEGDTCVTSAIEHACVRETLRDLRREGVRVTTVGVSADGVVDVERIGECLDERPTLVSVMAVNNEVGTVQPLAEVGRLCAAAGVPFHTDAAQAAGRVAIDVARDHVDLLGLSAHKVHGPQGIGALYCRPELRSALRARATGGGQEGGARPGTVPVALAVGFGAACELARARWAEDATACAAARDAFLEALRDAGAEVAVNGESAERVSTCLNLRFPGVEAHSLLARLPDLCLSTGAACDAGALAPSHVLLAMGLGPEEAMECVRVGFGRDTTARDVAYAARRIAEELAASRAGAAGRVARGGSPARASRRHTAAPATEGVRP